jgi:DNA-binding NarL/FixJ family response regulator
MTSTTDIVAHRTTETISLLAVDPSGILDAATVATLSHRVELRLAPSADFAGILGEISEFRPDILLLSFEDPGVRSMAARLSRTDRCPLMIAIVTRIHPEVLTASITTGCNAVILHPAPTSRLIETVAAIACHGKPSPAAPAAVDLHRGGNEAAQLTTREREVLCLLAEGHATKQIGAMLKLSSKTIETHRLRMMRKLNIFSVAGLTRFAIRHGLSPL